MHLLKTTNLTKDYGENRGIFDLNLSLPESSITGFVGPNGSGKTTTMSILAGYSYPDDGQVEILNLKVNPQNIHNINSQIGILISEPAFEDKLTAKQILSRLARIRKINKTGWQELGRQFQLNENTIFKDLSLGNKKKVSLIASIMHRPKVLILDEPTNGLDPIMQEQFAQIIQKMSNQGSTILLSSHILNEVQNICDSIIMIQNGKIILQEQTQSILNKLPKKFIIPKTNWELINLDQWQSIGLIGMIRYDLEEVVFYTNYPEEVIKRLVGLNIYNFFTHKPELEELFKFNFLKQKT